MKIFDRFLNFIGGVFMLAVPWLAYAQEAAEEVAEPAEAAGFMSRENLIAMGVFVAVIIAIFAFRFFRKKGSGGRSGGGDDKPSQTMR